MLTKRVIPCLDVHDGRVVKGVNFVDLRDAGDPVELARAYDREGADEVVFLDITATSDDRATRVDLASRAAAELRIPFTVGGGFRDVAGCRQMIAAGSDKVSVNSAAVKDPSIIGECAESFGRQCVVVAIDAKRVDDHWEVFTHGGTRGTGIDAIEWAQRAQDLGAGEILLTSMDTDGVKNGYDIPLTSAVTDEVSIPVIASGGCGSMEHIYDVFSQTGASAALAASIFHYGECTVAEVKQYLRDKGVEVR